jgi:hypothetical protein
MQYDQRMIITFRLNEGADARDIAERRPAQFDEHTYKLRMVQFWITEVRLGRQDLHDTIPTGRPLLDRCDDKFQPR